MTTEEFCAKLKEFCLAHGFTIEGTCISEGISGEITVCKANVVCPDDFNFVYPGGEPVEMRG